MHIIKKHTTCVWIGIPKPHLRHSRLADGSFVVNNTTPVFLFCFSQYVIICTVFAYFCKHQINENPFAQLPNIVWRSHVDLFGCQNNVQYLSIHVVYLAYRELYLPK